VDTLKARDAKDVEQAVRDAIAAEQPLEIVGHGTKRAIGQPVATNAVLDLSALNAVTSYEPQELIVTVQAGAPVADVISMLDAKNQQFGFEPMDTSVLMGTPQNAGTIGGMIGVGLAGPRRIRSGGVRDHLLGAAAVSGFGDSFYIGGKVVKNVTGYDLCKLLAGSWGTLSVMTEVTLKVMPKAEGEAALVLRGLDAATANRVMSMALGSSYDVSGAAHIPASTLRRGEGVLSQFSGDRSVTLIRIEGIEVSVADRARSLAAMLKEFGAADMIEDDAAAAVWASIRDVTPFAASGELGSWPVWRIVCPPASGGAFGESLARETGGEVIYDWGGGLIWAALPPGADAHAVLLRAKLAAIGGHATLLRAPENVRAAVEVFHPQAAGVAALSQRVKASFDPRNILNRGRMVRGSQP
jgi:glycolate oxidase FAD binding subunit